MSVLLFGLAVAQAQASFTSLYIFGDGISTTTNNPVAGEYYYGLRRCNGRVWVEVLAQRQGFGANSITNADWSNSSNNWSYYGQFSDRLAANLDGFRAPPDAATALFVVWVCDADFVNDMGTIYPSLDLAAWTNAVVQSLSNHWNVITNLYYAKGARTLVMPNAVDITKIPEYDTYPAADKSFIRQRIIDFNTGFTALLNRARASLAGITIYEPNFFALLDNILTNPAAYGLTNVLAYGQTTDVIEDDSLADKSLDGPGTNYIFWDATDPTAKVHEIMADIAQQLISPMSIRQITPLNRSNRLDVANAPVGLNGLVDSRTNLAAKNWAVISTFRSTDAMQTVFVPVSGPLQFYRLNFPFAWTWP